MKVPGSMATKRCKIVGAETFAPDAKEVMEAKRLIEEMWADGRIDASEFSSWMLALRTKKERYRKQCRSLDKRSRLLVAMVEQFLQQSAATAARADEPASAMAP